MKNTRNCNFPIYLNNAATSFPKAPGMGKEVASGIEKMPLHPGRSGAAAEEDILWLCREELARLVKAENPSRVVLCKNATEALNIAVQGMGLKGGEVVLTSAGEHNSVLRPLYRLEKKPEIDLKIIPCDPQGRVREEQWLAALDRFSPRLAVLNHASNVTGAVNQAGKLLKAARNKGCTTLLDAAQTLGLLEIDARAVGADMVAFTGHKYVLGPPGTGGLYITGGIELEPVFVGGTGIHSDLKEMPPGLPGELEPGTPAVPLFAGLLHSLKWQRENPVPLAKMETLTQALEQGLGQRGARVVKVEGPRTSIVSFDVPGRGVEEMGYILAKSFNIYCRTGLHCAPLIHTYIGTAPAGCIRLSLSRFTTGEEIDYVLDVIDKIMKTHAAYSY